MLRIGSLGVAGLTLPDLLRQAPRARGRASSKCSSRSHVSFCFCSVGRPSIPLGTPSPTLPSRSVANSSPLPPRYPASEWANCCPRRLCWPRHLCLLRTVRTGDNAHSSSGYYMLTGQPHAPMNMENANPAPNNWPSFGSILRRLRDGATPLPSVVRLPHQIFNTDGSIWPGQDAGFLGRTFDPWMFRCEPASTNFRIPEFTLPTDLALTRFEGRRSLLSVMNQHRAAVERVDALPVRCGHATGLRSPHVASFASRFPARR